MTNCVGKLRPIQRVKVEILNALGLEALDLFDRDTRRNHLPRLGVVLKSVKSMPQCAGNRRAAHFRESLHLWKTGNRQNTGDNGRLNADLRAIISESQKDVGVEKELRDSATRTRVEFPLQVVEIERRALCLRMYLGISGD